MKISLLLWGCGIVVLGLLLFVFNPFVHREIAPPHHNIVEKLHSENVTSGRVVFVGDIMLARDVEALIDRYGVDYPFSHVQQSLHGSAVIGNFEAAIPVTHTPTPSMTMRFSVREDHVPGLATAGFSHLSLANNHAFDYGSEGFLNTTRSLRQNGLTPFGHPYSVSTSTVSYVDVAGKTVALIGLYAVVENPSREALQTLMRNVNTESDLQIAYVHWGEEYELRHNTMQEQLAHLLVDEGVDMVVGHHPHVVQDIAMYRNAPIIYSLGNFVFDQYFSTDVQQGLMVEVLIDESNILKLLLSPVSTEHSRIAPRVLSGYEREQFLKNLATRSDGALTDQILRGELQFVAR